MHQSAFLFDYQQFRNDIAPVVEALDHGDHTPLYEWQKRVVESMKPEDWILHDEGTFLDNYMPWEERDSSTLGFWLLIVLSTYLRAAPSPLFRYALFGTALHLAGWTVEEMWLLLRGSWTATLIKPVSKTPPDLFPLSAPYWYWFRPLNCYQSGWLLLEEIRVLEQHLVSSHDAIMRVNQKKLGKGTYGMGDMSTAERIAHLHIAYDETLKMLRTALHEGLGLYMIIC